MKINLLKLCDLAKLLLGIYLRESLATGLQRDTFRLVCLGVIYGNRMLVAMWTAITWGKYKLNVMNIQTIYNTV